MSRKYSLYIPCYNAEKTIAKCLSSVMHQDMPFDEVMVIDDGSTDSSAEIAMQSGAEVISLDGNQGLAAARNRGVSACRNDFIASIDADVVLKKDWLSQIDKYFNPERFAGISGRLIEKQDDAYARWRSANMRQHWGETARFVPFMYGALSVFDRKVLLDAGGYDAKYKTNYEDYDICKRIGEKGRKLFYIPYAKAEHIKQDTVSSLLSSFWKWQFYYYSEKNIYTDMEKLSVKLKENIGLSNRLLRKSISDGNNESVYLDFLLGVFLIFKDIFHVADNAVENGLLGNDWLYVMDAVFYLKGLRPKNDSSLLDKRYTAEVYFVRLLLSCVYLLEKELGGSSELKDKFIKDMAEAVAETEVGRQASDMILSFSKTDLNICRFWEKDSNFLNSAVYGQQNFIFDLKNCYNAWNQDLTDINLRLEKFRQI